MIDLLHAVHHPPNSIVPIRLSARFLADLAWSQEFLIHWNGVSFLYSPSLLPSIELTTDAWGHGVWSMAQVHKCWLNGTSSPRPCLKQKRSSSQSSSHNAPSKGSMDQPSSIASVSPTPLPPLSELDLSTLAHAVQRYFQAGLAPGHIPGRNEAVP